VLLLEAGPSDRGKWDSWKIAMPSALTFNLSDDKYNWDYWTVPQQHMDNRKIHQPRGKTLGGSSSLNAMAYIRGHALDYERWVGEGAEGWDYASCLPYFQKAQSASHEDGPGEQHGGVSYVGRDGPLEVTRGWYENKLNEAFLEAGQQAGYAYTSDLNGYRQEGVGPMHMTVKKSGERASTAACYLHPHLHRPNLTVRTGCRITRVLLEGKTNPKAVGVEVVDGSGERRKIYAEKEVILCLGAFGSPHALMHSGIGDAGHLAEYGIDTVVDNAGVGGNLQDHIDTYIQFLTDEPVSIYPYATWGNPINPVKVGIEWFTQGTGVGASNHFEVGGFVRTKAGIEHPDLQYHFVPACVVGQAEVLDQHGYQVHCSTMRPLSKGHVRLQSEDPLAAPLIDPNFLGHPQDIEDIREGVRLTVELASQQALAGITKTRYSPGPEVNLDKDEDVDAFVRQNGHSAYHPCCTAAMGSVVDNEGRVYGVQGLRVIDASIMPSMVSGNLNAPTIMMAEKCADAIKGQKLPKNDAPWFTHSKWQTEQR